MWKLKRKRKRTKEKEIYRRYYIYCEGNTEDTEGIDK